MTSRPKIVLFLCLCVSFVSVSGECTAASQEDSGAMQRFTVSTVKELNDAIGSNREILLEPGDYILDDVVERDRYVTKWNGMRINFEFVENLTLTGLQGEKPVRFIFQGQKACSLRIFASKHVRIDNVVIEQSHCIEETLHIFHSSDISISNSIIQGSLGILHVSGSSAVTIDRTELQGSKRWGLRLQKVKGFHFVHSSISNCLAEVMVLHDSTQIAFDHARFFNNHQQTGWKELFRLSGDSDVSYSNCDIQGNSTNVDKRSDYTLFGVYGNAEASLRNSRIRKNSADYFLRPGEQALQETGSTFEANAFRKGKYRPGQIPEQDAPTQRITVNTVEQFLKSIGSNREIYLEPGDYMLHDFFAITDVHVSMLDSLTIKQVSNLHIIGLPGDRPVKILTENRDANVLNIKDSRHLLLQNVSLGHTETVLACEGGVLHISNSSDIAVDKSRLYGSGAFGVVLSDVKGFEFTGSHIIKCSNEIMNIRDAEDVTFENSHFFDNTSWGAQLSIKDSRNVRYRNCTFKNNGLHDGSHSSPLTLFLLSNTEVLLQDSRIHNNSGASFVHVEEGGLLIDQNCVFESNGFRRRLSPESEPGSFQERAPDLVDEAHVSGLQEITSTPSFSHVEGYDLQLLNNPLAGVVETRHTGLNIRQGPGTRYSIMASVPKGEELMVLGSSDDWYKVRLQDGRTGYAYSGFIVLPPTPQLIVKSGYAQHVNGLFFSPTGDFFIRRGEKGRGNDKIILWNIRLGRLFDRLPGGFERGIPILSNQDGQFIVNRYRQDDGLININVQTGEKGRTFRDSTGGKIRTAAFSPDGRLLASSHKMYYDVYDYDDEQEKKPECVIQIWNVHTEKLLHTFIEYFDEVNSLAFSRDGNLLAGSSWDYTVKLWDMQTGTERFTLTGHSWFVNAVAFSPDGMLLASGSDDGTVKLWDMQTGREVRTLSGHTGGVTAVAFSPDGRTIAGASWDGMLKLWDVQTGREEFTLNGHSDAATALAFRPDGRYLMSGGWDGRINVWDVENWRKTATLFFLSKPRSGAMPEWFITTPDGQMEFSTGALDFLIYTSGADDIALEEYKAQYYTQGLFDRYFAIHLN